MRTMFQCACAHRPTVVAAPSGPVFCPCATTTFGQESDDRGNARLSIIADSGNGPGAIRRDIGNVVELIRNNYRVVGWYGSTQRFEGHLVEYQPCAAGFVG